MTRERRALTIMIHRDGALESLSYRVPLWAFRAAVGAAITVACLLLLAVLLYGPTVRAAARVPFLTREIARLNADNEQVRQLAGRLVEMEARYAQVRTMLGGDIAPPAQSAGDALPIAHPVLASRPGRRATTAGPSVPHRWPLDERGVVTRGQISEGSADETHPGIDIAVPLGTPIRASGGGTVSRTGRDPEYGIYVLLTHPDGYQTMYGHTSRLLVSEGDEVNAGQVIALSGSTGRSSAPHLHFEIRRDGRSIDPRSVVLEDS
ncbi:MAG: M23 family metallopeptidase [Gemmatimonadetes bacterium]|nr:M23 family metallopeptidase [Gemmatimonadota bacterium]